MVKAGDIFIAKTTDFYNEGRNHYFFCIYSQSQDMNNILNEDIVGLMITTNDKLEKIIQNGENDYNARINLHNKKSFVCCDKIYRFKQEDIVAEKGNIVTDYEKKFILRYYRRFIRETFRQLER